MASFVLGAWLLLAAALPAGALVAQERAGGDSVPEALAVRAVLVRDAVSGQPVSAVRIRVDGRGVITDRAGAARVTVYGGAEVHFDRLGYEPRVVPADALPPVVELSPLPVLLDEISVEVRGGHELAHGTSLALRELTRDAVATGVNPSLADALEGVEGMSSIRTGTWGSLPVLRGMQSKHLAITVDGTRLFQACTAGMDQGLATVDPATVERVEVLAGPGSTLYGSGNVGGVINVVTRHHAGEGLSGEVRAGASTGTPGGSLGGTLRLGGEDVDGTLSLDLSSYGDYRTPEGSVDGSSLRQGTGSLQVGWKPSPARRVSVHAQAYEGREIGWPAMGMGDASIPEESRRNLSLDYGEQVGWGPVESVALRGSVQRLDHDMEVATAPSGGGTPSTTAGQRSHSTTSGGRAQVRLLPAPALDLDVGVDLTRWTGEATRWMEMGTAEPRPVMDFRTWPDVVVTDVGAFAQGEVRLPAGFAVTAGARLDRVDRDAEGWAATDEWVTTGNLGVRFSATDGLRLRANLGYGYRVPNPTELFGLMLRPDGWAYRGNPELATETNRNLEMSVDWEGESLSLSGTVYRNELDDLIAPVEVAGEVVAGRPVRSYRNVSRARIEGWSATALLRPSRWSRVTAGVSSVRGEEPGTGAVLPMMPPLEARLGLRLTLPGVADRPWVEVEATAADRQTRNAEAAGEAETPGYGLFDVRAGGRFGRARVTAGVDNLLDRAYRGHLDPRMLLRPGRSFYVRVSRPLG